MKPKTAKQHNMEKGVVASPRGHDADSYVQGYLDGKQAGIKEAVDWLKEYNKYRRFGFEDGTLLIYKEDWQSRLKEWGIDG